MMTEDDLREQLRQEVASVQPPGDLIPTLAAGHTRRYRRAQRMKVGAAAVALVAVATTLTTVLAPSSDPATDQSASAGTSSEIIKRAKAADAAARNMILHSTIDQGSNDTFEEWQQRATKHRRTVRPGAYDAVERPDGTSEVVDYSTKTWRIDPGTIPQLDPPIDLTVRSEFTAKDWYDNPAVRVDPPSNGRVRLIFHMSAGKGQEKTIYLWLDLRTYLPVRKEDVQFPFRVTTFEWLPPTADNLKSLTHTIPADFPRKDRP